MKEKTLVRKAASADLSVLAALGQKLWPSHSREELEAEFAGTMKKTDAVFFLAFRDGNAAGFAQCGLRHDYVEGTESSPVGYLEGIFVEEKHRCRGVAAQLLSACQNWARERKCREFASDCEIHNLESLRFHLHHGFAEAGRIICFVKSLDEGAKL